MVTSVLPRPCPQTSGLCVLVILSHTTSWVQAHMPGPPKETRSTGAVSRGHTTALHLFLWREEGGRGAENWVAATPLWAADSPHTTVVSRAAACNLASRPASAWQLSTRAVLLSALQPLPTPTSRQVGFGEVDLFHPFMILHLLR